MPGSIGFALGQEAPTRRQVPPKGDDFLHSFRCSNFGVGLKPSALVGLDKLTKLDVAAVLVAANSESHI
jgi:hypothetical protein